MSEPPHPRHSAQHQDDLVERHGVRTWLARRSIPTKLLIFAIVIGTPLLLIAGAGGAAWYLWRASRFPLDVITASQGPGHVFDRRNQPLFDIGPLPPPELKPQEVPQVFVSALLTREDQRFYEHSGVDFRGLIRAAMRNVRDQHFTQGASTLTMQLVRICFDRRDETLDRKFLEMALALRIERNFDKATILNAYINKAHFGPGLTGLDAASHAYFGRKPADLTLPEAATLAAALRNPAGLNPLKHPKASKNARDILITRMAEEGVVTTALADQARRSPVSTHSVPRARAAREPNYLRDLTEAGLKEIFPNGVPDGDGLRVWLTIDSTFQKQAETLLESNLSSIEKSPGYPRPPRGKLPVSDPDATPYLQGAFVVLDHTNGDILALGGGRSAEESRFNRAVNARRQTGSIFKPFVYTLAYEQGLQPQAVISDAPLTPEELPGTPGWNPRNADGKNLGPVPAEMGLVWSRNTVTIRVGQEAGLSRVADLASRLGFEVPQPVNSQIMIGNIGASPLEMAAAYGMFMDGGVRRQPHLIRRVEDRQGQVLYAAPVSQKSFLTPEAVALTHRALVRVLGPEGTARAASEKWGVNFPAMGKTGTTNDCRDAWFAGCADNLSCVVWVGMDRPEPITPGGLGSTLALPLWADLIKEGRSLQESAPASHRGPRVCRISSAPANPTCEKAGLARDGEPIAEIPAPCPLDHTGSIAKGDLWRELKYFIGAE